jgi:cardiolipin synthase
MKGDAVWSFTLMFIETWNAFCKAEERVKDHNDYRNMWDWKHENSGLILPYSDSPLDDERLSENILIDIINQSKHYVYVFTPYIMISEKMTYSLQMAAKRGVDVRVITPGVEKNKVGYYLPLKIVQRLTRSYYQQLLDAGVKIHEYSAGFIHAKNFICDDEIAIIGTVNLDYRSLYLHFECAAILYKTNTIEDIKQDAVSTMADSCEVLANAKKRGFGSELIDSILNLFAPLM